MQADTLPRHVKTFDRLCQQLQASVGHRLFTVSRILPGAKEVERIYTTNTQVYPVTGRKAVDVSDWSARMARGECFVANRPQDFGAHFGDLDTIVSIGLGSVINVPVFDGPRQLGTLNLLDTTGAYGGDVLTPCRIALPMAVQAFLEYEHHLASQPS
jgi:hypothetical protein